MHKKSDSSNHSKRVTSIASNMIVLYLALAAIVFWRYFIWHRPKNIPPGPMFRLPIMGQALYLGKDPIKGYKKLREKYAHAH